MASPAPPRALAAIAVGAAAASWGAWSVFLRPAALPAATSGMIVFIVIGVFALPWAWRAPAATWTPRTRGLLAANAALDAANLLTFFAAMQHTTVAIAVITHYLAPVMVAISAPWIDRQRVPGARVAAVIAIGGLALVLEPWRGGGAPLGAILGAASAVGYTGNVFVVRRLVGPIGVARITSYHSLGAAVVLAPFAIAAGGAPDPATMAWLAIGAILLGALGGTAFVWGVGVIGSAPAAMLTYLEPLVAVVIGAAVWDEPLGRYAVAGGVLVLASGIYVARGGSRNV